MRSAVGERLRVRGHVPPRAVGEAEADEARDPNRAEHAARAQPVALGARTSRSPTLASVPRKSAVVWLTRLTTAARAPSPKTAAAGPRRTSTCRTWSRGMSRFTTVAPPPISSFRRTPSWMMRTFSEPPRVVVDAMPRTARRARPRLSKVTSKPGHVAQQLEKGAGPEVADLLGPENGDRARGLLGRGGPGRRHAHRRLLLLDQALEVDLLEVLEEARAHELLRADLAALRRVGRVRRLGTGEDGDQKEHGPEAAHGGDTRGSRRHAGLRTTDCRVI